MCFKKTNFIPFLIFILCFFVNAKSAHQFSLLRDVQSLIAQ